MGITLNQLQFIKDEVSKTSEALKSNNKNMMLEQLISLDGLFSNMPGWYNSVRSYVEGVGLHWDIEAFDIKEIKHDLTIAMNKLISYAQNFQFNQKDSQGINLTQNAIQNISLSLDLVISNVYESLDKISMSNTEYEQIKLKIDALESLLKEPKRTRWEKAKDIIKWFADKSVDVFISVLPLIAQLNV